MKGDGGSGGGGGGGGGEGVGISGHTQNWLDSKLAM